MSDLHLEFLRGRPAPDVLGGYASLCDPLDAATIVAQWEATDRVGWEAWRWMVARDGRQEVVAAVPALIQSGRTATLWPVRTAPGLWKGQPLLSAASDEDDDEPPPDLAAELARRLLRELLDRLAPDQLSLLQVVLPSAAAEDAANFAAVGFHCAAELAYLLADVTAAEEPPRLHFRPVTPNDLAELTALIDQTYTGTLDCPALNGLRDTADVVAGYLASGTSGAQWWRIAEENGAAVGCVLTATHPSTFSSELVYMGVIPSARGRALGGELIREAKRLARESGMEQSVLAVDAANHPARAAYERAGYSAFDGRRVWLRVIR